MDKFYREQTSISRFERVSLPTRSNKQLRQAGRQSYAKGNRYIVFDFDSPTGRVVSTQRPTTRRAADAAYIIHMFAHPHRTNATEASQNQPPQQLHTAIRKTQPSPPSQRVYVHPARTNPTKPSPPPAARPSQQRQRNRTTTCTSIFDCFRGRRRIKGRKGRRRKRRREKKRQPSPAEGIVIVVVLMGAGDRVGGGGRWWW